MFFVGLTFSQILLITGIVLLLQSYILGGPFVALGAVVSLVFFKFYEKRKEKKKSKKEKGDICDGFDCIDIPMPKKLDCDCDCSPDCSN